MFLFFFLLSFFLSFIFLLFSFHCKKLHNQQQLQVQEEEGNSHNESVLLNDSKSPARENESTHLPHSLRLEIMPSDSVKWAGLFAGENQHKGDAGQFGSGLDGEPCESGGEEQRTKKKKKKRGKKKRLNSKSDDENGEERCSFSEDDKKMEESVRGGRVKPDLVCLYPFTSTSSATQRKIKQQYDQLVKCHENKGLTLAQVGDFANCLIEARNELQQKSEVIKRKFTITRALLFKADRSSFDRLRQQICKLEMEQKRLEEDAFVYNWLQQQLKLSPAYKKEHDDARSLYLHRVEAQVLRAN
ncbi:uncharacterized protein LOC120210265 isoform X3 [Hibiscus syriacus]|uniref:uncharacterized protein LOC120210265 isoform X3 n=1 Tax=Hibiscus syriacus TaxID=106335 RepID=UPI001922DFF7|nr:uncharacterized protein LOC120210265 isoform X3 [Hibiscus syriacus]